jgi:trigger factor
LAFVEGCKHALEISIPVDVVEAETSRVVADIQKRARLQGFRPGKAPVSLIRKQFAGDIRQQVLENLVPEHLQKQMEAEGLSPVGSPDIADVHFHDGAPLKFKATFEVFPTVELGEYNNVEVPYQDPVVTDEDIDKRINEIRENKAQYVNIDPRPVETGDFAVVSMESISGVEGDPVKTDELVLHVGGEDTLPEFTANLQGMTPGEEKEFDVAYPADYGSEKLAGKTVRFRAVLKGLRRKDLPEMDDDFAQELGDYRTVEELKEAVRKALVGQRQFDAQRTAKDLIIDKLVDAHDFPVPEVFVDRQIKTRLEQRLMALAEQGVDPRKLNLDWEKLKEAQRDKAVREVKASILLGKVSERESIHATRAEVDAEVEKAARQQRKPVAALHMEFEKDGTLGRISSHITTEKTLSYLFEHARKTAEA